MHHCVLVGNFGAGNAGDELLREYFVTRFPDVEWTVVSALPKNGEVPRLPVGVRSFFLTPWWRTVRVIAASDGIVFGGGSLFTDVESIKACVLWGLHALTARLFRKKIILAFQGVGPLRSKLGNGIARWVIRRSHFISVRDPQSGWRVKDFGRDDAVVTADPVPLLFPERGIEKLGNVIALIPRQNFGQSFIDAVTWTLQNVAGGSLRIISMQPDVEEMKTCAMLGEKFGVTDIRQVTNVRDIVEALSDAKHLVTERYHGALAGFVLGIPLSIVSQKKGDKLDEFRKLSEAGMMPAEFRGLALQGEERLRNVLTARVEDPLLCTQ